MLPAEERADALIHLRDTHIHADFTAGSKALSEATGVELALSNYDQGKNYQYAMPHCSLNNGDNVTVGSVRREAVHPPRHTPEHLSFVLFDTPRGETEPEAIFYGDS
jgi:hydroxyacylglutathione hydrolase